MVQGQLSAHHIQGSFDFNFEVINAQVERIMRLATHLHSRA